MSKKNDDFFKEKKTWSEVKDELLKCYLEPYMQKLLTSGKPIVYVDCFAGKGAFEDGKPGSPIIALETMQHCLSRSQKEGARIIPYFIDLNYADDLRKNVSKYGVSAEYVISGRYEDKIQTIMGDNRGCNAFLYIDPYGIKALNYELFADFSSSNKYNSVELLINLNSYGFIREGCRVLGVRFEDDSIFEDLIEYESTKLEKNEKSVHILNEIAGGEYWQEIIHRKNMGEIDTKEAEKLFADQYCKKLRLYYKYVLNMPLRIKRGHPPKYRMVHATNHTDGCLIMVNNICGRWELMKDIQSNGQMTLFEEDIDNNVITDMELSDKVYVHIQKYTSMVNLRYILTDFFMIHGPICKISRVTEIYKRLEKAGRIEVYRDPPVTERTKQPTTFFTDDRNKSTCLRWIR